MALTVSDLFKESAKYHMKLLAGKNGLNNLVYWVHIIETIESVRFLRGNELVITEGILENEEGRLLSFVEKLFLQNASALVVNTGMFIKKIPDCVIAFCDEKGFPLFSIPWEVPLVDVTREYSQRIMDNSVKEDTIVTTFKNLIFGTGDKETQIHQMERYGYLSASTMLFLCFSLELEKGTEEFVNKSRKLKSLSERLAKMIKNQYISFEYQERRIVVLIDYTQEEIDAYIDRIFKELSGNKLLSDIYIGLGDNIKGMEHQNVNFMRAYASCQIARRKQERVLGYQELGLYKLLVNIENADVLEDFHNNSFGKLIKYDEENGTDYYKFIKTYIECDGHQGAVSDKLFIHRNTVNNYIKRIEEILDMDLLSWEGKAKLYVAYCIENVL